MSNPFEILQALDARLTGGMELIIHGRAAIALGWPSPPEGVETTADVDGIIPLSRLEELEANWDFWDALEQTNQAFESRGLYMTHLFQEDQLILSPGWMEKIVPLSLGLAKLRVARPATSDLILTKMMRGEDPQDLADIRFMIEADRISPSELEIVFAGARVPPLFEIEAAFHKVRPVVLEMAKGLLKNP